MSNVVVTLSESDAKWLHEFLQAEYKREGFRPHEKPKLEVQSIGAALQRAMSESVSESLQAKLQSLMYYLTKEAARTSYREFLEFLDINEDEYQKIKAIWKDRLGVKPYV